MKCAITLTLLVTLCVPNVFSQSNDCVISNTAFNADEELTYVISYAWFFVWTDVGEVSFKVNQLEKDGKQALHLYSEGTTYPFYDLFFKVRDIHESWVDPTSLKPLYFNRNINEGNYTKENELTFDWDNNILHSRVRRRGRENRFYEIPLNPCTFDVVSALYVSRNLDFSNIQPNQTFNVNIALDREVYGVTYRFIGKEEITVKNLGKFRSLKFRVELIAGSVFSEGQYLYVWVTDDENKIPLHIESPIKVGSVKARIADWEGLLHPLSSKID